MKPIVFLTIIVIAVGVFYGYVAHETLDATIDVLRTVTEGLSR